MRPLRASHSSTLTFFSLLALTALLCGACSKGEAPAAAEASSELAYEVSWDLTQTDPDCEEECEAKMAVILEAATRVVVTPAEVAPATVGRLQAALKARVKSARACANCHKRFPVT